jgi:signal peptidase I
MSLESPFDQAPTTDQAPIPNPASLVSTYQVEPSPAKPRRNGKGFWLDALETIAIAFFIFIVIYNFIAQPHLVKGESMLPNYHDGEYILTSKLYTIWGSIQRGDVVVLKSPDDDGVQFIKRVIGLPGEKIKIDNNQITIFNQDHPDGMVLHESYISPQVITEGRTFIPEGETITIPKDRYVVMGDNRNYSYDSRAWGFLAKDGLVGKAFFVYWPIPDFGIVQHASYK